VIRGSLSERDVTTGSARFELPLKSMAATTRSPRSMSAVSLRWSRSHISAERSFAFITSYACAAPSIA